jgi:hypothetical protein
VETATASGAGRGEYRKNSNGLNFTVRLLKSRKK